MRIGQFIATIDATAGGTSTAFLSTLAALRTRAGSGLTVRAYTEPPVSGDPAWTDINAHPADFSCTAGRGHSLAPGPLGRTLIADIDAGKLDLLHIHGVWSPDLLAAGQACLRRNVPYLWQPHGMLAREAYAQKRLKKELFMALGLRRVFRGAAGLVFVTAEERDQSIIPSGIGPERKFVVPLPVQGGPRLHTGEGKFDAHDQFVEPVHIFRDRARHRFTIPPDAPCIVFMGRFHPVKRIEMILHAAAIAAETLPGLHVLLFGGGDEAYEKSLRDLDKRLGQHAIFAGWVHGDDKWLALAAGEVLTLNSLHENFGFVAVEALCVGTLPVLTTNLALAPELKAGNVALLAEPNEHSLAQAWIEAITQNRQAQILSRGRAWVQAHLSTQAVGEKVETIYRQVLARPR